MGSFASGLGSGAVGQYNAENGIGQPGQQGQQKSIKQPNIQPSPQQQPVNGQANPYTGILNGLFRLFTHPSMQGVRPTFPGNPTAPGTGQGSNTIGMPLPAPPQQQQGQNQGQQQGHAQILTHLLNLLGLGQQGQQ